MNIQNLFRRKSIDQILKEIHHNETDQSQGLVKNLTIKDLMALGIAAIVGAGIFSTIGNASAAGGPAVSLLFVFTAIACVFSALCYAQFASTIPISGSAYTYAYTAFGEVIAWSLGWNLLLEYAISNIAVAISWSEYFTTLLDGIGLHIPDYLTMDYLSAARAQDQIDELVRTNREIPSALASAKVAWDSAPVIGGIRFIADIPALAITALITYLVFVGIKESKTANNILVVLKMIVILLVVAVGAFFIKPENWSPFAPNGLGGVMKGVSAVFFAYIGFDSISTTAEECNNPQRDLPRAMIYALILCTVMYVLITLVLTGMVDYKELAVGDPLAYVFEKVDMNIVAGVVAVGAVVAMTSALLVYQLGQPRIWMAMSRDGLLPKKFATIHPKYKTPSFSTVVAGFVVAIPALFMNLTEVTDLTSIGTLFAFALVSGGILLLEETPNTKARFKVPYVNGKYIVPVLLVTAAFLTYKLNPEGWTAFTTFSVPAGESFWSVFEQKILMIGFIIVSSVMAWLTYSRNLSLIPVMGLLINLYLMTELGPTNWLRFLIWLLLGLIIYFGYGYRNSKLRKS